MISIELARKLNTPARLAGAGLLGYAVFRSADIGILSAALGTLIAASALLPGYLWTTGRTNAGLPIFPMMSLTFVWTSCLPLLSGHAGVQQYTDIEQATAAGTTALFLLVGTAAWYRVTSPPHYPPATYRGYSDTAGMGLFDLFLTFSILTHTSLWWELLPPLSGGMYSMIRSTSLSLAILSVTVLTYRWGAGRVSAGHKVVIASLIGSFCAVEMGGVMIHGALSTLITAFIGYTLGRGRPPVLAAVLTLAVFSVLHVGKWPMREQYWNKRGLVDRQENYFSFYSRWFDYGLTAIDEGKVGSGKGQSSSSFDRASVIHMVMLVQRKSPNPVPYLDGDSYAVIPELLVPRILYSQKAWSHEGTYRLAIAYGLQSREATRTTTIGFGPLAEAYANFGFAGVLGLAVFAGGGLGWATRISLGVPITSLRSLWSMVTMSAALQTESTLGVSLSSLSQSTLLLAGLGLVTMRTQTRAANLP